MTGMILFVIGLYALVTILTRFAFPLVPLYLIGIGVLFKKQPIDTKKHNHIDKIHGLFKLKSPMNSSPARNLTLFIFPICFLYWAYLFFSTKMNISMDAEVFNNVAEALSKNGWIHFFQSGPHREPLYPMLIIFSKRLSSLLHYPFDKIQTIIQLGFLFLTQLLTLHILRKLEINKALSLLIVLYLGVSPAIVNSAFSLFSEIITYPIVLGIIFVALNVSFLFIK